MTPFLFTALWVAYMLVHMTVATYFSWRLNSSGGSGPWFMLSMTMGFIPVWTVVARYSRNIVADAVLYDSLVAVVYFVALLVFSGQVGTLRWWQYLGFLLATAGAMLVRWK
jgi:hypothetical protein